MGQCISEQDEKGISDTCIICNKCALGKPTFVCPLCNTKVGHMNCVTFWVIIHKTCPHCANIITALSTDFSSKS